MLCCDQGGLYLADFGLAHLIVKTIQTVASSVGGTPNYSPPEQLDASQGPVTEKIDIWAFACVALELLTGSVPWSGKTIMQIMAAVVMHRESPSLPAGCEAPAGMAELLQRCLEFEAGQRPSAAEVETEIHEEWRREQEDHYWGLVAFDLLHEDGCSCPDCED